MNNELQRSAEGNAPVPMAPMGEPRGAESTQPSSAGAQTHSMPATIPTQEQKQESPASAATAAQRAPTSAHEVLQVQDIRVPRREDALSAAVPRRGRVR